MYNEIFEVSRDEYNGFIDWLKPGSYQKENDNDGTEQRYVSKLTKKILCARINNSEEIKYYIFELPEPQEKLDQPIRRAKLTIETPEQLEALFTILGLKKGE